MTGTFYIYIRKFNHEFYTNKLKIFYSRVLKDVFIVKNVLVGAFYVVLNDVLVHFFTKFWKFKKTAFFRYVKRLGMTTVDMPGHGFTFPVGGIVPVIFSSMIKHAQWRDMARATAHVRSFWKFFHFVNQFPRPARKNRHPVLSSQFLSRVFVITISSHINYSLGHLCPGEYRFRHTFVVDRQSPISNFLR
jgi:hypothetical protein